MAITKKQREQVEQLIIKYFDQLDKSKTNSDYYRKLFADMSDSQFEAFMKKDYPIRFQMRQSVTEPSMSDIEDSLKAIGVPMLERITMPFVYTDKDGNPVQSKECLVVYDNIKKVQQFVTKKSKWALETGNRDMRTGRLIGNDKGTAMSDREFESLATLGLEHTMYEFSKPKADAMMSKAAMNSAISSKGYVTEEDLPNDVEDSLSRNMINAYLIGCHLESNLVNKDGYTPYTLKQKQRQVERI